MSLVLRATNMIKPYRFAFLLLTLVCAFSQSSSQDQDESLARLLPATGSVGEWSGVDSARIYKGKELYKFIDGGADLFLEYGFVQALAMDYQKASGESINLEIYEMRDPGAAYGIYSVRSGEDAAMMDIGQGGGAHPYYIMFWKERYYVSVAASDSTQECRIGLEAVARAVDRTVSGTGQTPVIVGMIPEKNLLAKGYFRGYLGLSLIQIIDLIEIFPVIDGAFGTYKDHTLIFLRYDSTAEARKRLESISSGLRSNRQFKNYQYRDGIAWVTDARNQTLCFSQSGPCLVLSVSSRSSIAVASCRSAVSSLHMR